MAVKKLAVIIAAMFGLVVIFQIALAFGAPWGEYTQGGGVTGPLAPVGRFTAVLSAGILIVMALGMLARAGMGPAKSYPPRFITAIAWLTTVYAGLAILANLATPSGVERAIWAPFSFVSFAIVVTIMVKTRKRPNI